MKKINSFFVLTLFVAGCASWFVAKTSYNLILYFYYDQSAIVKTKNLSVVDLSKSKYAIKILFDYAYNNKTYQGTGQIDHIYPNPWAANQAINELTKKEFKVFFRGSFPEKFVFDKKFPYKSVISSAILLALVCYFFFLGIYSRF